MLQKKLGDPQLSFLRREAKWCSALALRCVDEVRAVLNHRLDATDFLIFFINGRRGSNRINRLFFLQQVSHLFFRVFRNYILQPFLKPWLSSDAHSRQVLPAQCGERLLVRELPYDALVLDDRVVGLAELAVTFSQPENRRRRNLPVLVELRGQRLVVGDGRVEVAVGLLLEQSFLQG